MKTDQLPSDLINQAITNCTDVDLALALWECMKQAAAIEIRHTLALRKHEN